MILTVMDKMAFQQAPNGFSNSIPDSRLWRYDVIHTPVQFNGRPSKAQSNEVMQFMQYQIGAVKTDIWVQRLTDKKISMDSRDVQSIVNSLIFLYRISATHQLTEEQFREQLQTCMVFSDPTLSALTSTWSAQGRSLIDFKSTEQLLDVGKLVDMKWKVGMAVSSDSCKNLNSPFICLSLTISDGSGNLKTHDLELTMDQFRNFTNQMKEIATIMETV